MSTPPALPGRAEYGGYLAKYAPPSQKTYATLADQVMDGTRFVTLPYVVSIVILTFQRNLGGIHEVRTGKWPVGEMAQAALVTVFFGWWGLPFGPLYSLLSCFYLCIGGRDATREILENTVGKEEARRILLAAIKPEPPASIWVVRAIILTPLILAAVLACSILSGG